MNQFKISLLDFIKTYSPVYVAEIGVLAGKVPNRLLSSISSIKRLYMVDPWLDYRTIDQLDSKDKRLLAASQVFWEDMYSRACKVSSKYGERAVIIRRTSIEAVEEVTDILDIVIIDADHTFLSVLKDINIWILKIKVGGVIIFHDYMGGWGDVVKAVNLVFGVDNINRINDGYCFIELLEHKTRTYLDNIRGELEKYIPH